MPARRPRRRRPRCARSSGGGRPGPRGPAGGSAGPCGPRVAAFVRSYPSRCSRSKTKYTRRPTPSSPARVSAGAQSHPQILEAGAPVRQHHGHLAVQDGGLHRQPGQLIGDRGERLRPVLLVARVHGHRAPVDTRDGPVAVELDLVQPALARGRCADQGGQLRAHEARRGGGGGGAAEGARLEGGWRRGGRPARGRSPARQGPCPAPPRCPTPLRLPRACAPAWASSPPAPRSRRALPSWTRCSAGAAP